MRNILNIVALLLLAVGTAWGGVLPNTLVVKLRSGETADFTLADRPKLTFEGKRLVIKSESYEVAYELSKLDCYYFADKVTNSIGKPGTADGGFRRDGDRLSFRGLAASSEVTAYTAAGVLVATVKVGSDGCAALSLGDMPKGVYVVKYGNVSTKIQKR